MAKYYNIECRVPVDHHLLKFSYLYFQWVNPADVLNLRLTNVLNIAPPQFYEMCRLCR